MIMGVSGIFRHAKFRRRGENGKRAVVRALRHEGGANAFAHAAVAFVAHDVEREVDGVGKDFRTGGDGIEARLQLRQQADEFLRREFDRRMFDQKIDHLQAVEVGVEILFPLGMRAIP